MARCMRGFSDLHFVMRTKDEDKTMSPFSPVVLLILHITNPFLSRPPFALVVCLSAACASVHVGLLNATHCKLPSYVAHGHAT